MFIQRPRCTRRLRSMALAISAIVASSRWACTWARICRRDGPDGIRLPVRVGISGDPCARAPGAPWPAPASAAFPSGRFPGREPPHSSALGQSGLTHELRTHKAWNRAFGNPESIVRHSRPVVNHSTMFSRLTDRADRGLLRPGFLVRWKNLGPGTEIVTIHRRESALFLVREGWVYKFRLGWFHSPLEKQQDSQFARFPMEDYR